MGHWNYRVIASKDGYSVAEVYYDETGRPHSKLDGQPDLYAETKDELQADIVKILEATFKAPLHEDDFA